MPLIINAEHPDTMCHHIWEKYKYDHSYINRSSDVFILIFGYMISSHIRSMSIKVMRPDRWDHHTSLYISNISILINMKKQTGSNQRKSFWTVLVIIMHADPNLITQISIDPFLYFSMWIYNLIHGGGHGSSKQYILIPYVIIYEKDTNMITVLSIYHQTFSYWYLDIWSHHAYVPWVSK